MGEYIELPEPEEKKRIPLRRGDIKTFVCNLLAQYKKPREVVELVKKHFDEDISSTSVYAYYKLNKQKVDKYRSNFVNSIQEVPISHKRIRLEREDELYEEAGNISEVGRKIDIRLKCLANAREEVEGGKTGNVTFAQINQYNNYTDEELLNKKKEIEENISRLGGKQCQSSPVLKEN